MNVGASLGGDSWVVIEQLDHDFNTLREVYYSTDSDLMWYCAESITTTMDGGVLMTAQTKKLSDQNQQGSVVVKFPSEVFDGIDEAHANGLKLAIAYPNPGGNEMHIRTAVENATVEVYDMNGRLVAQQPVTETETVLDATDWVTGTYVWKVVSTQTAREIESGKWVKK